MDEYNYNEYNYNDVYQYDSQEEENPNAYKTGLAIAALVISIINLVCCCGIVLGVVAIPVALVLAIISLVTHRGGKAMAIISIVISAVCAVFLAFNIAIMAKFYPDVMYFAQHDKQIIAEYEETGKIPERYEKYRGAKYDKYWDAMGVEGFDEFFATFIEEYKKDMEADESRSDDNKNKTTTESYNRDGEELVELAYQGALT